MQPQTTATETRLNHGSASVALGCAMVLLRLSCGSALPALGSTVSFCTSAVDPILQPSVALSTSYGFTANGARRPTGALWWCYTVQKLRLPSGAVRLCSGMAVDESRFPLLGLRLSGGLTANQPRLPSVALWLCSGYTVDQPRLPSVLLRLWWGPLKISSGGSRSDCGCAAVPVWISVAGGGSYSGSAVLPL